MNAEIIMIGTELLLGEIIDTNATYMARTLAENGINLFFKTTVGDNRERILHVLSTAMKRAEIILTSGGLGPTEDDITRECVAELTQRPLEFRPELYEKLQQRFTAMKRVMTPNNQKQAFVPQGATAIPNPNGTAPGLIVEHDSATIICMPGVPRELIPMLEDYVIPYLRKRFSLTERIWTRTLKVYGMGESKIDAVINDLIQTSENPKIGLLASPEFVRIRLTARTPSLEQAQILLDELQSKIEERLPHAIAATDENTIEKIIDKILIDKGWSIAVAETSSGGLLSHKFTIANVQSFRGGIVLSPQQLTFSPETANTIADQLQTQFQANCQLVLLADPSQNSTLFLFRTPETIKTKTFGFGQINDINPLRICSLSFDTIRRTLLNIQDDQ